MTNYQQSKLLYIAHISRHRRRRLGKRRTEGKEKATIDAGRRSVLPRQASNRGEDKLEGLLVKKETLAMGGAESLNKSESEVHVSISGNCIYNTYSNPSAYITQKDHTSSARSGEDGCSGP